MVSIVDAVSANQIFKKMVKFWRLRVTRTIWLKIRRNIWLLNIISPQDVVCQYALSYYSLYETPKMSISVEKFKQPESLEKVSVVIHMKHVPSQLLLLSRTKALAASAEAPSLLWCLQRRAFKITMLTIMDHFLSVFQHSFGLEVAEVPQDVPFKEQYTTCSFYIIFQRLLSSCRASLFLRKIMWKCAKNAAYLRCMSSVKY